MKNIFRFLVWFVAGLIRAVFWAIGWFIVPFTMLGDGQYRTPKMWRWFGQAADIPESHNKNRWTKYIWMAWRNPLEGLDGTFKQPILEKRPNPDAIVRTSPWMGNRASRWMTSGLFIEYWYMRRINWSIFGKRYKYFEFRIGWKFVDGNEDFVPTLQLGPRSS